jgi:hypothetical protein
MANVRAMVILPNTTGLAEDQFINTWHFTTDVWTPDSQAQVQQIVRDFYNVVSAPSTGTVASFLSAHVDRAANKAQVRLYNLADPLPREPVTFTWQVGGTAGSDGLPNEVAVCLSMYADRNLPRQRGRLFLGPFKSTGMQIGTGDMVPSNALVDAITHSADEILDKQAAGPAPQTPIWCVRSDMDNVLRPVTAGWVDRAFDTIRKRGKKAASRAVFPVGT